MDDVFIVFDTYIDNSQFLISNISLDFYFTFSSSLSKLDMLLNKM